MIRKYLTTLALFLFIVINISSLKAQYKEAFVDITKFYSFNVSPLGTYLMTGHKGGVILWDGNSGALIKHIPLKNDLVLDTLPVASSTAWSPDETRIAIRLVSANKNVIQIVDIATENVLVDNIDGGQAQNLAWSPNGEVIAVPFTKDMHSSTEIHIIDAHNGDLLQIIPLLESGFTNQIKWNTSGSSLAVVFHENFKSGLIMLDSSAYDILYTIEVNEEEDNESILDFEWYSSDSKIITSNSDGLIQIWSSDTGQLLNNFFTDLSITGEISANPNNELLAVKLSGIDTSLGVVILDPNNNQILDELQTPTEFVDWKSNGDLITIRGSSPLFFTDQGEELPQYPVLLIFGLVEGEANNRLAFIQNQNFVDLSQFPPDIELKIQAYPNFSEMQSVRFYLNGIEIIDNEAPFIIELPAIGEYELTATSFDTQGNQGSSLSINFNVIDSTAPQAAIVITESDFITNVTEDDALDNYNIVLGAQPTADVVGNITGYDGIAVAGVTVNIGDNE